MSNISPKPDQQTSAETTLLTALNNLATSGAGQAIQKTGASTFANVTVGGSLVVGTTVITSGTTTRILYDNAGVVGEYTLSGSGTVVAMATSPSFTTPTLGVATATSINGLTITATTGSLTMTNGKTLSVIKTMSFTAADDTGAYTLPTGTKTLVASDVATLSSLTSIGTIGTGVWNGTAIIGTYGGTGVNNGVKTFTYLKNISFTAADDTGVYMLPTGTKTLLATDGSAASLTSFPTFNQNTSGSAASLSVSGQTGLITLTGIASTSRIKTVRDAADTILELGGSYTPTGTWTSLTMVTPVLGTPTSGTLTNTSGYKISSLAAATAALSLTFPATNEMTFTYSATTQTGLLQTSTTITSGMIEKLSVTGSSVIATSASSGFLLTLTSAGTGMTAATQRLAAFYSTGANGTASVVLQGLDISISNTGTTNTNQALRLSASGGSTTNIALDLAAGELRLAGSAGTSGKILVSGGVNASPVWSTPTFPNASATSRKIIVSDGTNWVASTETYAAPGNAGNELRSDGTNWVATQYSKEVITATDYADPNRFSNTVVNGGNVNITNSSGGSLDTGTSSGASADCLYGLSQGGSDDITAGSPSFAARFTVSVIGTSGAAFVGVGSLTVGGTGITFTVRHFGFKVLMTAGPTGTLYATQADGTTENASSALTTIATSDVVEVYCKLNGTSSIDYYWRLNGAAWSSATNLTTNFPSSACGKFIEAAISNSSTTQQNKMYMTSANYRR